MTEDRRSELMAGAALGDLDADEMREMSQLGVTEQDVYAMELAAATVVVASMRGEGLPPALHARVTQGAGLPPRAEPSATVVIRPRRDFWRHAGWLAAAAFLVFAVVVVLRPWTRHPATAASARAELLAKTSDAKVIAWAPTTDEAGASAHGDVVWSNTTQRGFMRFRGLSQNDPTATQYQLWIFDAAQDEKYPIDGGVFDVAAGGEVVIPIQAKIKVTSPTLFAVTVEKPGGVVVSKRERIVVTAKVI